MNVAVVYPNQLFADQPAAAKAEHVLVAEEGRFFAAFAFHKKKLIFHRATMKCWAENVSRRLPLTYLEWSEDMAERLERQIKTLKAKTLWAVDPVDTVLSSQLTQLAERTKAALKILDNPAFLTPPSVYGPMLAGKKRYQMTSFYIAQRKRLKLLCDEDKPRGGQWTFDTANRKSLPKEIQVPPPSLPKALPAVREATAYVERRFADNPGDAADFFYPVTPRQAQEWLSDFLRHRFAQFGPYEDAIDKDRWLLFHSLLSPLLNVGLLTPQEVIEQAIAYADAHGVAMQSVEGFVRQILGWREFVRAMYMHEGQRLTEGNFFAADRPLPAAFYTARTGLPPVDAVIARVQKNAYAHHIERLMALGTFMQLCHIRPQEVYRWFMEMFIDAYDWVMTPNVFGMSQFSAGAMMMTKPYLCGSNYILKMSNFPRGDWCAIWDALFWSFLQTHRRRLLPIVRMRMMLNRLDQMPESVRKKHKTIAEQYLKGLFQQ